MPIYALGDLEPRIDASAYVHPDAVVIGDVPLGPESSVWPGAVLRGDYGRITIGARTSEVGRGRNDDVGEHVVVDIAAQSHDARLIEHHGWIGLAPVQRQLKLPRA